MPATDESVPHAACEPGLRLPRRVAFDAPWDWLAAGWRDMWQIPDVSLGYGAIIVSIAVLLFVGLWSIDAHSLIPAIGGGFLLLGPFATVGLYEASRRLQEGKRLTLSQAGMAWLDARGQVAFFGAILLAVFMLWLELALLLSMLFLGTSDLPQPGAFMQSLLLTTRGLGLLIAGSMVGGLLAAFVFAISVVALPMLLAEDVDAVTAARASMAAVFHNPKPMVLWAALIVVIMAAGFATLLAGLIIVLPLIGHATWHAYSALYGDPDASIAGRGIDPLVR